MSTEQTNLANDSTDPVVQINGDSLQVREIPAELHLVINQSKDTQYVVDIEDRHCSCPSHKYHDEKCKHRRAVEKVEKIEEVKQEKYEEIDEYYEELLEQEPSEPEEVGDLEEVLEEADVEANDILEEIEEESEAGDISKVVEDGCDTHEVKEIECPDCGGDAVAGQWDIPTRKNTYRRTRILCSECGTIREEDDHSNKRSL